METFLPLTLVNQNMATGQPFYDIFVPQNVPLSKISDYVTAYDFWFAPLQSKILATPMF